MRTKVTNFTWGGIKNISIMRFNCSEDNLLNLIDLFEYKAAIMEIGTVEKNSSLFQAIKTLSINYMTSLYDDCPYTDVVLMVNSCDLEELIHCILIAECESFSIEGVENNSKWEQYLYNRFNRQQLIKREIVKLSMVVLISEAQVDITFHKDTYNTRQVILKIKEQFC